MAVDPGRPLNPTITIGGTALSADLSENLIDVRVERRLQLPSTFTMRFRDRDFSLIDGNDIDLGDVVTIAFTDAEGNEVTVTSGEVTAIGADPGAGDTHELVVSGLDLAHRLSHSKAHRTYLNMGADAIVGQIATRAGLTAKASSGGASFEYLAQVDTDHRLLDELARLCGCDWWVDKKDLHFAKPADGGPVTLTWGDDLKRFKLRLSTVAQAGKVTVRAWGPDNQSALTGTDEGGAKEPTKISLGGKSGATDALTKARKTLHSFNDGTIATAVNAQSAAEAEAIAKAFAAEAAATALTGKGEAYGHPELKPGGWVKVDNMGTALSGTYAMTEVDHVWGTGLGLITRFTIGGRRPDDLVDLFGTSVPTGPLGDATAAAAHGPLLGVVSNITDPDNAGRVKVKLSVLGDQVETTWARLVAPGGGPQAGLALQPAVGDEVLVVFERGDLRSPLVIGGLWTKSRKQPGPAVADGKVVRGQLRSRKGHVIELGDGDADDASHLRLALANGTVLRIGQDKVSVDVKKGPFSIVAGSGSIEINDQGDVTIKGRNVTVKADQKLALSGNAGAELTSAQTMKVSGNAKTEISASGSLKVQSGGVVEVAGALVKLG